jgi:cytochrome bd-type quinol oxidase subunit 2
MWIALFAIGGAVVAFLAVIAIAALIIGVVWFFQRKLIEEIFGNPDMLTAVIVIVILNLALAAGTVGAIAGGIDGYHRTYGEPSVSTR